MDRNAKNSIAKDSLSEVAPYRLVNIGNSKPEKLMNYIKALEDAMGFEAKKTMKPIQQGDVPATWADTSLLMALTGSAPSTSINEGVKKFVEWYLEYNKRPNKRTKGK